jgi:hypothetical protein
LVVTPLTVTRSLIGVPTATLAGGVVVEMSRVRVITEGCTSENSSDLPRVTDTGSLMDSSDVMSAA